MHQCGLYAHVVVESICERPLAQCQEVWGLKRGRVCLLCEHVCFYINSGAVNLDIAHFPAPGDWLGHAGQKGAVDLKTQMQLACFHLSFLHEQTDGWGPLSRDAAHCGVPPGRAPAERQSAG